MASLNNQKFNIGEMVIFFLKQRWVFGTIIEIYDGDTSEPLFVVRANVHADGYYYRETARVRKLNYLIHEMPHHLNEI